MDEGRRRFLIQGGALALSSLPLVSNAAIGLTRQTSHDSLAMQLYKSLSQQQRDHLVHGLDHHDRVRIANWWNVNDEFRLKDVFSQEQIALCRELFLSLHSEDYRDQCLQQLEFDSYTKGFADSSIGFYGSPEDADFEFIFTSHHVTRRGRIHSEQGSGFAGPIFYGHLPNIRELHLQRVGEDLGEHPGLIYAVQNQSMNGFYQSLSAQQQDRTFCRCRPRNEFRKGAFALRNEGFIGLPFSELHSDQKSLLLNKMREMLSFLRPQDAEATWRAMSHPSRVERLHIAFFAGEYDEGSDGFYEMWQIEGPDLVWFFRGRDHLHAYLNVRPLNETAAA